MGYESLERDSLITLSNALRTLIKKLRSAEEKNSQLCKDVRYELGRVERML